MCCRKQLQEEACRLLTFTMFRDPGQGEQLNLQDICQQNIQIVDQQGATVFAQTEPSCMSVGPGSTCMDLCRLQSEPGAIV